MVGTKSIVPLAAAIGDELARPATAAIVGHTSQGMLPALRLRCLMLWSCKRPLDPFGGENEADPAAVLAVTALTRDVLVTLEMRRTS